ncbi:penicillin-binding transpeptidase domain-containing protein [Streptomyces kunmingensis]|uniref:Penicillin-binding transpeptidase domain-containing protein n=1 Tax=Streptomyces kunmingensis TaxID=68225 RepID=A0ABU6C5D7_9ACTN|nr:penicillin-binding transpeptidase domain-containing protein [Streptomyces kunmingensis]MEB3959402.1 penicillin-binding transpeptidase domain-containing protein [Streptomyces kunmingensis]
MTKYIRRASAFCLLLLVALLLNAARVQVFEAGSLDDNAANRRATIQRYGQPRGEILVRGRTVTGSKDTGQSLRYERTYKNGPLYSPVTGYASQTYGTTFVESAEDDVLSGTDPMLATIPFWNEISRSQEPGGRAETTLDPAAQQAAYTGLGGRKGAVAAVEPSSGKILALVSTPSYDPGDIAGTGRAATDAWSKLTADPDRPMLNRAIRQTYPPGSTFKVVTAAAALENEVVDGTGAKTDTPSPYTLPGTTTRLTNESSSDACENASLEYALRVSCNTVFADLGVRVGLSGMVRTAEKFGFNDSGLRIPMTAAKSNFDTDMNQSQLALSSIGQYDTAATPLQMAMVAAAVANGGTLMSPYLVERTSAADGSTVATTGSRTYKQAMSPYTATALQRMMVDVVERGTGTNARISGATVGGKTGTAQNGVNNEGVPYAWFLSYAQARTASSPQVAVAVVVEDAAANRADISGGGSAAPIARSVMRAVLDSSDR